MKQINTSKGLNPLKVMKISQITMNYPAPIMGLGLKNTNAKTEGIVYLSRNGTVYTTSLFQIPIKNMEDNINCLVPAWVLLRNTKTPIIYTRNLENSFLILILLIIRLAQPFWNQMASRT